MAKIVHKGMWISVKSLDKEDRKNYLVSMILFFIGAIYFYISTANLFKLAFTAAVIFLNLLLKDLH